MGVGFCVWLGTIWREWPSAEIGIIRDCLVILEGLRCRLLDHCLLFLEEWASCLSSIDGLILDWVILLFCSLSFIPFFGFVDSFFGFSIIDPPREQRPAQSGIFARNTQRNATNEFRGIIHSQRKFQIPTFSENISVRYLSFSDLL